MHGGSESWEIPVTQVIGALAGKEPGNVGAEGRRS